MSDTTALPKDSSIEALTTVGAHYGYSKGRRHASIKPYIFGNKNGIELIDLENNEKVWVGQKHIKKIVKRSRFSL